MKKKITVLTLALALAISLVGCGGSSSGSTSGSAINAGSTADNFSSTVAGFGTSTKDYDYDYEYTDDYEINSEEAVEADVDTTEVNTDSNNNKNNNNSNVIIAEDKLIYKCNVDIETLNFDESYKMLQDMMTKYNCFISSERFSDDSVSYFYTGYSYDYDNFKAGRVDEIVIRVPSANYKSFVAEYGNLGNVTSKTQTVDNITQEYYDTTSQVEGLKAQMERLEIMLAQATEIEDMVTINQAITELQYEINKLSTYIRTMDSDVAYSYVTMTLREVLEYSEVETPIKTNTFFDRLKNQCVDTWEGFLEFLEDLLFAIIGLIPAIVILGIVYVIVRITCKNKIKAWKEKRKLRKTSGYSSVNELNALLNYDETKINSEVNTDENRDKQDQ